MGAMILPHPLARWGDTQRGGLAHNSENRKLRLDSAALPPTTCPDSYPTRRARESMRFELIDLQLSFAPTLLADAADGVRVVDCFSGDFREMLPWARYALSVLAGGRGP
jgi:hypothetical protein